VVRQNYSEAVSGDIRVAVSIWYFSVVLCDAVLFCVIGKYLA